MYLFV